MAEMKRVGDLQVGEDLKAQRRNWAFATLGSAVMIMVALAGFLGLFGGAGSQKAPWTNFRFCEVALLGNRTRSATHASGAWATGCFQTHVSARTPPPPGCDTSALLDLAHKLS
jgi:hypothetical protein